jgi:hypothetical protein
MKPLIFTLLLITIAFHNSYSQQIVFRQPSSHVLSFIGNDSIALSSINYYNTYEGISCIQEGISILLLNNINPQP